MSEMDFPEAGPTSGCCTPHSYCSSHEGQRFPGRLSHCEASDFIILTRLLCMQHCGSRKVGSGSQTPGLPPCVLPFTLHRDYSPSSVRGVELAPNCLRIGRSEQAPISCSTSLPFLFLLSIISLSNKDLEIPVWTVIFKVTVSWMCSQIPWGSC